MNVDYSEWVVVNNTLVDHTQVNPVILQGKHVITLLIRCEHIRLLHCGPTLLSSSLNSRVHIIAERRVIRSITRSCVTCRRIAARPQNQNFLVNV